MKTAARQLCGVQLVGLKTQDARNLHMLVLKSILLTRFYKKERGGLPNNVLREVDVRGRYRRQTSHDPLRSGEAAVRARQPQIHGMQLKYGLAG